MGRRIGRWRPGPRRLNQRFRLRVYLNRSRHPPAMRLRPEPVYLATPSRHRPNQICLRFACAIGQSATDTAPRSSKTNLSGSVHLCSTPRMKAWPLRSHLSSTVDLDHDTQRPKLAAPAGNGGRACGRDRVLDRFGDCGPGTMGDLKVAQSGPLQSFGRIFFNRR